MQKIIHALPVVVVMAAISIIGYQIVESRKAKKKPEPTVVVAEKVTAENLPISKELPEADRQLVARVFNTPEELDAAAVVPETRGAVKTSVVHPVLLSEVKFSEQPETTVTADWNPAFQKDFESLRTDAIRNPDSEQNRTTVNTLMQKRQQRLAREKR